VTASAVPEQVVVDGHDSAHPADARARRWAVALFAVICVLYAVGIVFDVLNAETVGVLVILSLYHALTFSFPLVGVLIARRQPRNAITWILLGIGAAWALGAVTEGYATYALATDPGALPAGDVVDAATTWLWVPGIVPAGTLLLLLFPDGHLPSRGWRWVVYLSVATLVLVPIAITIQPATLAEDGYPDLHNPLHVEAVAQALEFLQILLFAIPVCMVASAAALVVRFRRARGAERLQLKWLAAAAAVVAGTYAVALIASSGQTWTQDDTPIWALVLQIASLASLALIPISIGVAILRYRLYDIDRLISRTIAYSVLTALLVAVYAAIVVGVGAATGRSDNPLLIAGATLAVAALFRPARRSIQGVIDRRLFRRRYDPEQVMGAFAARLRNELDIDALERELRSAARDAVQPERVAVWIRGGGGPR
jgi:hypothetical protein